MIWYTHKRIRTTTKRKKENENHEIMKQIER